MLRYIQTREPEPESNEVTALGAEEFTLIWVAKSADLITGYLPELASRVRGRLRSTSRWGVLLS